jgi:hypothetical protein
LKFDSLNFEFKPKDIFKVKPQFEYKIKFKLFQNRNLRFGSKFKF